MANPDVWGDLGKAFRKAVKDVDKALKEFDKRRLQGARDISRDFKEMMKRFDKHLVDFDKTRLDALDDLEEFLDEVCKDGCAVGYSSDGDLLVGRDGDRMYSVPVSKKKKGKSFKSTSTKIEIFAPEMKTPKKPAVDRKKIEKRLREIDLEITKINDFKKGIAVTTPSMEDLLKKKKKGKKPFEGAWRGGKVGAAIGRFALDIKYNKDLETLHKEQKELRKKLKKKK